MKRIALLFLTVCFTAFLFASVSNAQTGEDSCTREDLTKITDKYFGSIQEHKTSDLPLASTVKFTENGVKKDLGKGFCETAGKPLLRRTLIDTKNVLETKDQDWKTILPSEKRTSRKVLADAANHYFDLFAENSTVSVPFAEVCDRWENGLQTTAADHDCSPVTFRKRIGMSINHGPRRVWVDTEKGISIAFMVFGGGASASKENPTGSGLVDCHMFRMRDGKVDLIQSIVGPNAASMGWPLEPIE